MVETKSKTASVNLEALDCMVTHYMLEEDLIDDSDGLAREHMESEVGDTATNLALRAHCESVRHLVEAGDIDAAISMTSGVSPAVLQDQRLHFRLLKQKFIEQLRRDCEEGRKQALGCLRGELAPLALNAYPEAYGELKRSLLLLVYGQHEGVRYSKLALLLRYLAFTLRLLRAQAEPRSSSAAAASEEDRDTEELLGRLLCKDRDPPPLPPECSSLGGQGFAEADIHSLKEAVALSRQEAVEALLHAGGDVRAAFLNELASLHLCLPLVDDLVLSYAADRDLLRMGPSRDGSPAGADASLPLQQHAGQDWAAAMDIDQQGWLRERTDACVASAVQGPDASNGRKGSRAPHRQGAGRHDVTAGFDRQPSKSPPKKVPRWRGRPRSMPASFPPSSPAVAPMGGSLNGCATSCSGACVEAEDTAGPPGSAHRGQQRGSPVMRKLGMCGQAAGGSGGAACAVNEDPRNEFVRRVRRLIEAERFDEALEDMQSVAPACLGSEPDLTFQLHLARFHVRAAAGDMGAAVAISRACLTPISRRATYLEPLLKAALARLLEGPAKARAALQPGQLSRLAGSRLQAALGIREPQLVQVLRVLLASHRAWLKLQRCKDRFEPLLGLDALKATPSLAPTAPGSSSAAARPASPAGPEATGGSRAAAGMQGPAAAGAAAAAAGTEPDQARHHRQGHAVAAAGDDDEEDSDDEGGLYGEDDVVLVMEFAGLGRAAAIELLREFGGDTEAVLASMYP